MGQPDISFKVENRPLLPDEVKQLASLIIDEPDHYTALGVDRNASYHEINRSYCLAVKYFHPLKYQTLAESDRVLHWTLSRAFRRIEQAYFILSSRARRKDYDGILDRRPQCPPAMTKQEESAIRTGNAEIWRALAAPKSNPKAAASGDKGGGLGQEGRRVSRVAIRIPVIVTLGHQWQEVAESRDISPLGIKLALAHAVEPGSLLRLELPMPVSLRARDFEDEIYAVNAYVLYVTEKEGGRLVAAEFV
jgi:hypothetical protein